MVVRFDARVIFSILIAFIIFIFFSQQPQHFPTSLRTAVDFHAVMLIASIPKNKSEHDAWDHKVHLSLPDLNKILSVDTKSNQRSKKYPHKRDHIFLTHAHGETGSYCFHIPSTISFQQFAQAARAYYEKQGFAVSFHKDYIIKASSGQLNNPVIGYEGQAVTLDEYEKYGNMSLTDFDTIIAQETNVTEQTRLKQLKEMRPYFNWHLKIPTVGILPDDQEVPEEYKPLSWLFSAWDLAPSKGAGVNIAHIDTGACGAQVANGSVEKMEKHPNIESFDKIAQYGLNLVSENGLDPIHQLAISIKKYCRENIDTLDIEKALPEMIIAFLKNNDATLLQNFLMNYGQNMKNTDVALQDILYGDDGILPDHAAGFFTLVTLDKQETVFQSLPSPLIKKNMDFMSGHGTFTQGIIHAQPAFSSDFTGIAPAANMFPLKALEDNGSTTKQSLDHALRKAMLVKADVVNLSLKASEEFDNTDPDDALMKQLIDSFDYVVAASGNDGNPKSSSYVGTKLAYPARFEGVAFDVGGFMFDNYAYTYGHFSQYEPGVGPKILAPGFNMLSSGIDTKTGEMCKIFMGGTSAAVPVITGCLAVVLGEFKEFFSRQTILKVMYASSIKMNEGDQWENNVGLGMIDLRSSLLCLHILKEIKIRNLFDVVAQENNLIEAILTIFFNNPNAFSSKMKIVDLKSNFSGFRKNSLNSTIEANQEDFIITKGKISTVTECIEMVIQILQGTFTDGVQKLQGQISEKLKSTELTDEDLFASFNQNKMIDNVIKTLHFKVDRAHYWHQSIDDNLIKKANR